MKKQSISVIIAKNTAQMKENPRRVALRDTSHNRGKHNVYKDRQLLHREQSRHCCEKQVRGIP